MANVVQVLRTGRLYVLDMADPALKEAGIPHFMREEGASGMRVAMPVLPSEGPGVWWTILVAEEEFNEAKEVIDSLPFETSNNPDPWEFCPSVKAKLGCQIMAAIYLIGILVMVVIAIVKEFILKSR